MALPVEGVLQDVAVGHGAVGLGERGGLVLDAEHRQVLAAGVLQRALAVGRHADDATLADGEDLTIDLVLALATQDEVELLVRLVGVQKTAVLSGNERLEGELAGSGTNGLPAEDLALNREVRAHGQLVFDNLADAANVDGGIICTLCNLFNLFHCVVKCD